VISEDGKNFIAHFKTFQEAENFIKNPENQIIFSKKS
jgi:hypothetical protein